jgi:hypothetical protein
MKTLRGSRHFWTALLATGGCALGAQCVSAADIKVSLSGAEQVPPVTTSAKGAGTFTIGADKTVTGQVTTSGVEGVAAHIHLAPKGKSGPPIITLTKSGDNVWSAPAGAKLTDEQYASFKAGELYVNVHSAAHKSGEIRGQLQP